MTTVSLRFMNLGWISKYVLGGGFTQIITFCTAFVFGSTIQVRSIFSIGLALLPRQHALSLWIFILSVKSTTAGMAPSSVTLPVKLPKPLVFNFSCARPEFESPSRLNKARATAPKSMRRMEGDSCEKGGKGRILIIYRRSRKMERISDRNRQRSSISVRREWPAP